MPPREEVRRPQKRAGVNTRRFEAKLRWEPVRVMRKREVRKSEERLSFIQVRGARSRPEGRSLAPRERERGEGPGERSRPFCRAASRRRSRVPSKRERRLFPLSSGSRREESPRGEEPRAAGARARRGTRRAVEALLPSREPAAKPGPEQAAATATAGL